jgi:geranylgeranyl pyrophosphate synthase
MGYSLLRRIPGLEQTAFENAPEFHPAQLVWQHHIYAPLHDLLKRPKKEIRAQVTEIGFELARSIAFKNEDLGATTGEILKARLDACTFLIEYLHTGSLIIDDIQDNSQIRRGDECIHNRYGVAIAINLGNWMYFEAFHKILTSPHWSASEKTQIYELSIETLRKAHLGQCLDIGCKIDQLSPQEVIQVCTESLKLKSGALMSLALQLGFIAGKGSETALQDVGFFGQDLGIHLQMYDDLGNLNLQRPTAKHLEDLQNRRPSFVWWYVAAKTPELLPGIIAAIPKLPDTTPLKLWIEQWNDFKGAKNFVQTRFQDSIKNFETKMQQHGYNCQASTEKLNQISIVLNNAY